MVYGYARVSTADQNLDRQLDALRKHGIDKLFCEKMSGTKRTARSSTKCFLSYQMVIPL